MKMRKIMSWVLIFCLCGCLVGCGSSDDSVNNLEKEETEIIEQTDTTVSNNVEEEELINEVIEDGEEKQEKSDQEENIFIEPFNTSPTIEETLLWDEKEVKVTAKSLEYTNSKAELNLLIENSSDKNLRFTAGTNGTPWNAVNGYMIADGYLNETVNAGESIDCDISFWISSLEIYGIHEIADIQFAITVTDENYDSFFLIPQKIETSLSTSYNYEEDSYIELLKNNTYEKLYDASTEYFSTDILFDNNGISMISEALICNSDGNMQLFLEMNNQSDYNIYAVITDIYINEQSVYEGSWTDESMLAGTYTVLTIDIENLIERSDLVNEDLISNGFSNVSFTLTIKNEDYEDALMPETIILFFN